MKFLLILLVGVLVFPSTAEAWFWSSVRSWFHKAVDTVVSVAKEVVAVVQKVVDTVKKVAVVALTVVVKVLDFVDSVIDTVAETAGKLVTEISKGCAFVASSVIKVAGNVVGNIVGGNVGRAISQAANKVGDIVTKVGDVVANVAGKIVEIGTKIAINMIGPPGLKVAATMVKVGAKLALKAVAKVTKQVVKGFKKVTNIFKGKSGGLDKITNIFKKKPGGGQYKPPKPVKPKPKPNPKPKPPPSIKNPSKTITSGVKRGMDMIENLEAMFSFITSIMDSVSPDIETIFAELRSAIEKFQTQLRVTGRYPYINTKEISDKQNISPIQNVMKQITSQFVQVEKPINSLKTLDLNAWSNKLRTKYRNNDKYLLKYNLTLQTILDNVVGERSTEIQNCINYYSNGINRLSNATEEIIDDIYNSIYQFIEIIGDCTEKLFFGRTDVNCVDKVLKGIKIVVSYISTIFGNLNLAIGATLATTECNENLISLRLQYAELNIINTYGLKENQLSITEKIMTPLNIDLYK